jgi:hypothetical protein
LVSISKPTTHWKAAKQCFTHLIFCLNTLST